MSHYRGKWSPVEVMLPRLLGVGQARCYYTNGQGRHLPVYKKNWLPSMAPPHDLLIQSQASYSLDDSGI